MKKLLYVLLVVVLALGIVACAKTETPAATKAPASAAATSAPVATAAASSVKLGASEILIGHYGPLTGSMSLSGISGRNGALLYMEEINAKGGIYGTPLKMIEYDDKSSPEQAVKAVERLVTVDKVHALVGSLHSGNILASAEKVEAAKIPELGTGTSPNWLQKGYKYLFRPLSNTDYGAEYLVAAMKQLGITKLDTIIQQDDYGKSSMTSLKQKIDAAGGITIINNEAFQPTDVDWTGQIAKCNNSEADALVFYATSAGFGPFYKQSRQLGYKGYIFGPESSYNPDALKIAGDSANGTVFFCAYFVPRTVEEAPSAFEKEVLTKYVARFKEMPTETTIYRSYDSMRIIERGIKDAKSLDGTAIRDAIKKINDMDGLFGGKIDFTKFDNGECTNMVRTFVIHGNKPVTVDEFLKTNAKDTYKKSK